MTEKSTTNNLRLRAEERIRTKAAETPEKLKKLTPEETRQALHELRVHQIELEMQNEELRRAQAELDATRVRYFDLYDLAPVGYCTLSEQGLILEATLMAATLLGVSRGDLVKLPLSRFIHQEDQDTYYLNYKRLLDTRTPQVCELRIVRRDGARFCVRMQAIAAQESDGMPVCRVVISDITALKEAEEEREKLILELQEAFSKVKMLSGLLPVCASCKKIRNDKGYWEQIEVYIRDHSEATFTHGICPACAEQLYPEYYKKK
ncbi:MAG: PAS domain-containing protein [Proteobacteria bacterium]|nr:PAS domain-containing protein [Pseudomonadota bacterium]